MAKVLGFPIEDYDRSDLQIMTDVQLNDTYLEDTSVSCYDNVNDFFNDLNDDCVDTENMWWFMVDVD